MRLLHFLPYFVAGLFFDERHLNAVPRPRLVGGLGVVCTMIVCVQVDSRYLGHAYFVPSWEVFPHIVFFLQYLLCGIEVLAVMLVLRSIAFPLFPYGHPNSTLAIYEWHWPIVGMITWGQIPFSSTVLPGISNPSLFLSMATHLPPWLTLVFSHCLAYCICVVLGSRGFWRFVRPISDPDCGFMFHVHSASSDELKSKRSQAFRSDEESLIASADKS